MGSDKKVGAIYVVVNLNNCWANVWLSSFAVFVFLSDCPFHNFSSVATLMVRVRLPQKGSDGGLARERFSSSTCYGRIPTCSPRRKIFIRRITRSQDHLLSSFTPFPIPNLTRRMPRKGLIYPVQTVLEKPALGAGPVRKNKARNLSSPIARLNSLNAKRGMKVQKTTIPRPIKSSMRISRKTLPASPP